MKRKTKIYFIIAATILLMIVNLVFSIIFRGDSGANIFTTISGWVSGVATIVLGLIALWVNARYKNENDIYLEKQSDLQ